MVRGEPSTEDAGLMMLALAAVTSVVLPRTWGFWEIGGFFYGDGGVLWRGMFSYGKPLVGLFIPMIPFLVFLVIVSFRSCVCLCNDFEYDSLRVNGSGDLME